MKYSFFKNVLFSVAIMAASTSANATLILNVSDAGGGQTLWQFSGSDVISSGGQTSRNGFWFDEANTTGFDSASTFGQINPTSNSFAGMVNATALGLRDLFIEDDRFGIRTSPTPQWDTGDTISWSGSFVANVAISNFVAGSFTGSTIGTSTDFQQLRDGFVLNVDQPVPAPEPTAFALMALGLAGLGFSRKRKAA